jgi:hypothetical protein
VLPVAIGGGIVGAAALIVGGIVLFGKSSSSSSKGQSTVSIGVTEPMHGGGIIRFH